MPKYDYYDSIIRSVAIDKIVHLSQVQAIRETSTFINNISYYILRSALNDISRQSLYNWIKKWNIPNIVPESIETSETLCVMADEKYIGVQDIDKDIIVKCFVAFKDVKSISKSRNSYFFFYP